MDANEFVRNLKSCGWFDAWPPGAEAAVADKVGAAIAAGSPPWRGLIILCEDGESGTVDDIYAEIVQELAANSRGAFPAEDVVQDWNDDAELTVRFRLGGQRIETPPIDEEEYGDYLDPNFFTYLNQALARTGSPLRLIVPYDVAGGQEICLILASPAAYRKVMAAGLIPTDESFDEPWQCWNLAEDEA